MNVTRYEPWGLHRDLLSEVSRLFDRSTEASTSATADWTPPVDIHEYADRFVLHADVPGIDPATIEITLDKGVLTLSGSRERQSADAAVQHTRLERSSGRFLRRFVLPDTVESENVSASGKNGVLEIVIPKRAQAQPRKIEIKH